MTAVGPGMYYGNERRATMVAVTWIMAVIDRRRVWRRAGARRAGECLLDECCGCRADDGSWREAGDDEYGRGGEVCTGRRVRLDVLSKLA